MLDSYAVINILIDVCFYISVLYYFLSLPSIIVHLTSDEHDFSFKSIVLGLLIYTVFYVILVIVVKYIAVFLADIMFMGGYYD